MAHQDGADKGASGIARVGKRKWGYDPAQVDAFLDRAHALYESEDAHLTQQDIQNVSFDLSKGGNDITQVDAALSRLEQAVVDKQTTREITEHGRVAWKALTEELDRQGCELADRGTGERVARGHDRRPSYDRKQGDRLIDQIVDKAAAGLGGASLHWTAVDHALVVSTLVQVGMTTLLNSAVLLPLNYRFGYEKAKYAFYLMVGLVAALMGFGGAANEDGLARNLLPQGVPPLALLGIVLIVLGLYSLSWRLSVAWYGKAEL